MFKAFPDLKIIDLIWNPIDLIYSWMMKDYGNTDLKRKVDIFKIGLDPSICGTNGPLPWYLYSIKNDYESLNQTDKIIASIEIMINLYHLIHPKR